MNDFESIRNFKNIVFKKNKLEKTNEFLMNKRFFQKILTITIVFNWRKPFLEQKLKKTIYFLLKKRFKK